MINVEFDTTMLNKVLWNSVKYSNGFLDGVESSKLLFNTQLGQITVEFLNKYIDSKARMSPESLHHVYEWNRVGIPSARLFKIESVASASLITFSGQFLPSRSVSETSEEPFVDKANVMENRIQIVVEPKESDVLAFEINGDPIFTVNSIYIDNPGGDEVAGSFGRTVEEFFQTYFTTMFLGKSGVLDQLKRPNEFEQYFAAGTRSGSGPGKIAGAKYMSLTGIDLS
jgi:hypothetical protein